MHKANPKTWFGRAAKWFFHLMTIRPASVGPITCISHRCAGPNPLFSNRIKPLSLNKNKESGIIKLLFYGDGNLAENQIEKGQPLSLGYDKWTNNFYSNKDLIINGIHYLTSNEERLALRKKTWKVAFLDENNVIQNASFWKVCLLLLPLLLGFGIGGINQIIRSKQLKV